MPNHSWDNLALMFYFCITWVYCNLVSVDLTSWFQFLGLIIEVVSYYTHWRNVDKEMTSLLYYRSNFGDISCGRLAKGHQLGRPQNLSSSSPSIQVAYWISASWCLVWSLSSVAAVWLAANWLAEPAAFAGCGLWLFESWSNLVVWELI